jgi:hypothetical protein
VKDRLVKFLEKCDAADTFPERLRRWRAVELLEHLGTAEAKALLEKLSRGGPSRLTTDAAGALKRLPARK